MNRVILIGRLTKDVELRKTTTQLSVTKFTLAVDRRTSDKEATADFINCTAWRQQAEFLAKYGEKGRQIAIEGRLQTGSYKNKEDQTVYTVEVVVDQLQLLGSKTGGTARNETTVESSNFGASNTFDNEFDTSTLDISSDDLPF